MAQNLDDDGRPNVGEPIEQDAAGGAAPAAFYPPQAAHDADAELLLPPHADGQFPAADDAISTNPHSIPAPQYPLPPYPPPASDWVPASPQAYPAPLFAPPPYPSDHPVPPPAYNPDQAVAGQEAAAVPDAVASHAPLQPYVSYLDNGAGQGPPGTEPVDDTVYEPFLPTHYGLPEHPPRGSVRVFYSVDPTRGTLDVYPRRFCAMINEAINESRGKKKGEIYLGKQFFDATVIWNHSEGARYNGDGPKLYQTTPGSSVGGSWKSSGMRDVWVKDFDVSGARDLCHEVQRVNYEWTGFISERLPEGDPLQRMATTVVPEEHFVFDAEEEFLPRWQWCKRTNETMNLIPWEERTTGRSSIFNVLEKDWGFYTEEVDQQIQAAHAAGEPHVDVVLCSRQYRIIFEKDSIYAKQVDPIMRKERVARLVYMKPSVVQQRMAGEACNLPDGEVCPICLLEFRETPTIQVIALPCGHQFHGMCIQNEADKNHKCPYCRYFFDSSPVFSFLSSALSLFPLISDSTCDVIRSEVDWASLFATYGNSVGNTSRRGGSDF